MPWCVPLQAQSVRLDDRTVPGFSATDSSILSVDHMGPERATSLTLFSTLRNDDLLPRDVAVEVLPLLKPHEKNSATILERYKNVYEPDIKKTLYRYLGMSLSISQDVEPLLPSSNSSPTSGISQISFGLRTFLKAGRSTHKFDESIEEYAAAEGKLQKAVTDRDKDPKNTALDDAVSESFIAVQNKLREIGGIDKSRVGVLFEFGGAGILQVEQHTLKEATLARWAYWINPIYRFDNQRVDLAALLRYIGEPSTGTSAFDYGGRVTFKVAKVYYSEESIGRHRSAQGTYTFNDLNNARHVVGITYAFNDSVQVNFTFGKNFKNDFSHGGTLLASFGLRIGLGEIPLGLPTERP